MPETINLRDYLEYIDNLLEERQPNEAAFHSRHIIGQRPKDIGAYRRMGRALIALDQWDEAGEVLRRVLSVVPDDQRAHLGLSRAYHYTRKPAQAIWHLERAWEHDPNNTTLSDELRQMYFVHHKVEDARLQLTTGAVARQYVRNGLYDQAINLLANTLKQAPDRVDLRLLLALTQREAGQHIKAAETALDIISVLPDCLSANRILAELWLMEGRPSDAQRYLSRIEAVDPYLAVRLAGGEDADPNLFQVMYGDYEQSAMREMADVQPDWLSDLDDDATLLRDDDESDSMLAVSDADDDPFADIVEPEEADDDPFADLMAMDDDDADDDPFADIVEPEEAVSSGGDDDDDWWSSASDDEWFSDANERAGQMTGELNADFDSVMADLESEKTIRKPTQGLTGLLSLLDDDSALADESRPVETTSADDDGDDAHGEDDPFAGVADGDDDLPDWLTPEGDAEEPAAPEAPASDPDDPFAWMRDSGIEVDEDADVRRMSSEALEDDDPAEYAGSSGQTDPLAWLKDSGVELDEEDDDAVMAAEAGEDKPATDPLSWLKDSGVEMDDGDDFADGDELDDVTLQLGEDDEADDELIFDDEGLLDEAQAIEDLLAADSTATEGEADMSDRDADDFNWLDDDGDDESGVEAEPDWLASMADDDGDDETTDEDLTADDSADDDEGDFEALYALEPEEEDNDSLDLLAEAEDVGGIVPGPRTADDMPDEASIEADDPLFDEDDAPADDATEPDWLAAMSDDDGDDETTDEYLTDDDSADDDEGDFEALYALEPEEEDNDSLDLLAEAEDAGGIVPGPRTADDMPDEQSVEPMAALPDADAPLADEDDAPEWLGGLTETAPDGATDGADDAATEADDSLFDFNDGDDDDAPDWLDDVADVDTDDVDFFAEEAEEEPVAKASTDWLRKLAEDDTVSEAETDEQASAEAITDDEDDDADDEAFAADFSFGGQEAVSDDYSWLNALQDEEEEEEEEEEEVTDEQTEEEEELDGLFADDDEDQEEDEQTEEEAAPDWLMDMADDQDDDQEEEEEEEEVTDEQIKEDDEEELDGLFADDGEDQEEEDEQIEEEAAPDWLMASADDEDDEEDDDAPDWLTEAETDATPEWLTDDAQAQPLSDLFAGEDDEDDDVPDWLADDADDEEGEPTDDAAGILGVAGAAAVGATAGAVSFLSGDPDDEETFLQDMEEEDHPAEVDEFDFAMQELDAEQDAEALAGDDELDFLSGDETALDEDELYELEVLDEIEEPDESDVAEGDDEINLAPVSDEEVTGAQNAPDWLNALAPGFDVEYEAEEDPQLEKEFLPERQQAAVAQTGASVDFGWLMEIVQAEMYQRPDISMDNLPGTKPAPAPKKVAAPQAGRFRFSRLPVWVDQLRGGAKQPAAPAPASADEDNIDMDDLPDWLTDSPDDADMEDIFAISDDDAADMHDAPDIDNEFFRDDVMLDDTDQFGDDLFAGPRDDDDDDDFDFDDELFDDDLFDKK